MEMTKSPASRERKREVVQMMWRKKVFTVLSVVAIGCLAAGSAQAVFIQTSGVWTGPVTGNAATAATVTGVGTNQIGWGTPLAGSQSSYEFIGLPLTDVGPVLSGGTFPLGDFVHHNFPIENFQFLGADLTVTVQADLDGDTIIDVTHDFGLFHFTHVETPNDPCAFPGCDDLVTVPGATGGVGFTFNMVDYLLILEGFQQMGGGLMNPFETIERQSNQATLFARIQPVIPEPTTVVLLGLGLVGLGIISRRRKKA